MPAAVRLRWNRDSAGYDVEARGSLQRGASEDSNKYIVPRGGEVENYWLDGDYWLQRKSRRRIFKDLASADCTPEDALRFANEWGFLFRHQQKEMSLTGEDGFYNWVHYFTNMLVLAQQKNYKAIRQNIARDESPLRQPSGIGYFTLDVAIVPGAELPYVFIQAQSLLSFAVMEMMQVIAGGEIRTCAHCLNFFTLSTGVNRRSTRKYCSDRCRLATSRAGKKKEAAKKAKKAKKASLPVLVAAPSAPHAPLPQQALPPRRRRKPEGVDIMRPPRSS